MAESPKCPSCKKMLTTTELFFQRCQVCHTDLEQEAPESQRAPVDPAAEREIERE